MGKMTEMSQGNKQAAVNRQ